MSFVRAAPPIWYFVDTNGLQLNDTYYAFFLTNTLPYIPQPVYQDPNGITPWASPLQFQPSGTLPNNLYFNPTATYRIEIRKGPDQTSPLIWLIENFVPGSGNTPVENQIFSGENMITNPQFADIDFPSPYTFTQSSPSTYTIDVAPGWSLVLTGAGTTILTQITNAGNADLAGNPPYGLTINNSGWTTAQLIQRFTNNPAIFGGGAAAVSFSAYATTNPVALTVSYVPSDSGTPVIFASSKMISTGSMIPYNLPAQNIPLSNNSDSGTTSYTSLVFTLPASGIISLSNIQFVGQSSPLSDPTSVSISFQEQTYERIEDHEFHVYKNSILIQPKDSLLVGWNFALNPWQYGSVTVANAPNNLYTADQTILVQQNYVSSATGNNVAVGRSGVANNYAYQVQAVTAHNQFAIIQYIDPSTIAPYWGYIVSCLASGFFTTTHSTTPPKIKMRLIYNTSLPAAISQTVPIASWSEGGDPVFSAGWTALNPINDPAYPLPISSPQNYFPFNGFQLPARTNANMTLGVVFYSVGNMNQNATADSIFINDISLVVNRFAIASNPKTWDQVLKECQYYFEKSYDNAVLASTGTPTGVPSQIQCRQDFYHNGTGFVIYATPFQFQYNTVKRANPVINLYSPSAGTVGNVDLNFFVGNAADVSNPGVTAITNWQAPIIGTKSVQYLPDNVNDLFTSSAHASTVHITDSLTFQYTLDSRLGI